MVGDSKICTQRCQFNSAFPFPVQYPYILPGAETVPAARAAGPRSGPPGSEAAMQLREISV